MNRPKIILLDDNQVFVESLQRGFRGRLDLSWARTFTDAKAQIDESVEIVLADIVLDAAEPADRAGLHFLRWSVREWPDIPVVVLTGHGDNDIEVEALRLGAADYVEKDGLNLQLLHAKIEALCQRRAERMQHRDVKARLELYEPTVLIGKSRPIKDLRELVRQLAKSDATALITGESGVGKEVVARALHQASSRRAQHFVAVNCAALTAGLLESELFGHEKGAFTGAHERRVGMFERAHLGTLLLDEVTEIDVGLQAKLLRALQERQIRRVGGNEQITVDVRILATTNRRPEVAVDDGRLRQDLFYRLNVLRIDVPPIRHRIEDIPLLVEHFLKSARRRSIGRVESFSAAAIELLKGYSWPGNVRELENIIERACAISGESVVSVELLAPWLSGPVASVASIHHPGSLDIGRSTALAQLQSISAALEKSRGCKAEAQQLLGFADRSTMRRRVLQLRRQYPDLWQLFPILASAYE